ncbi:hypothetical protein CLOSTMETH_02293 [[Clostridium] methylpentosum DSM 5476]|uniref:Uncharacterized protein n=1 Tax=[Clostridium] methylpentosum DSM 5476 TaxID=537013 RepID=C0EEK2_9FIRM|nr:hypothetical protein CLOSTMETH_02293 [[Clostridium] methylpentosum DSM 5476]
MPGIDSFLLLFLLNQGREVDKLVLNPYDGNATAVERSHHVKPPFGNPLAFLSNFGTTKSSSESAQKTRRDRIGCHAVFL